VPSEGGSQDEALCRQLRSLAFALIFFREVLLDFVRLLSLFRQASSEDSALVGWPIKSGSVLPLGIGLVLLALPGPFQLLTPHTVELGDSIRTPHGKLKSDPKRREYNDHDDEPNKDFE
jgi:hypothetical protein